MKKLAILFSWFLFPAILIAQPLEKRQSYDITKEKVLYTIGYAHLDTEWNWDYPTTINQYIRNTMEDNFKLFEKYPDYVFNFTGSRRYKMMKEYYPESYKKVAGYINQGRWFVSGSSVDEGEVNISSSESVLRQVLYGNLYFKREFNKESVDYMLPDCFGFVATMPSVWSHAGLLGFSTQKLTWRSSNGVPFNVGLWEGPDGKSIIASLNATDYTGRVVPRLDRDSTWDARLQADINKYDLSFDYRYYGVGDVGGAPRDEDAKNAVNSLNKSDSKFKVILTSSDQMYRDITPEIRAKLPTYSGDLLLIEHSAGSMTSQSYMKRANRKNEALSKSAELVASIADWLGGALYPTEKLNNSWELVLGSQFHDILPGTSIPKAYEYAWNDEFIAMNGFSEVLKNSVSAISHSLNTLVEGRAIVVYNPVAIEREDIVTAELTYSKLPVNVKVFDKNNNEIPSQVIASAGNKLTVIFLAKLPSAGLSVFDIRETIEKPASSSLSVTNQTLENSFLKVRIDVNGDIASIYDKRAAKEVLSKPATLDFQQERPSQWPSWNMDWNDRKNPPIDYMNKDVTVKIVEQGPVRVALAITKKGLNSEITQIISLASGEPGKVIEVRNEIDWQSREVSLKAAFPTTVVNEFATYSLNTAAIKRTTNNDVKFEVPGRQWIDITDRSNSYGISILEDCKYGSDKPDNSTLRLTLMYTPKANSYVYQGTQDWGIHNVKYGIYAHTGDWAYAKTPWKGYFLNNPPIVFETTKHTGDLGREYSLVKSNTHQVDVMAFKKAEESNYYIVRVNELYGKEAKGVSISFPGKIADAYEVNGQEKKIGIADFKNGTLNFDMTRFLIRTFAVKFENPAKSLSKPVQAVVGLPYNEDGISFDTKRSDGNLLNGMTIPAEMISPEIVSEDILFKIGNSTDGQNNMLAANGQKLDLPAGEYNKVYILAAATEDTQGDVKTGSQVSRINFQNWTGFVGQHYGRVLYFNNMKVASITDAFTKRDNIAWYASHRHTPDANDAYQYSYLFKYEIALPKGTRSITLPKNSKIKIFAVTVANNRNEDVIPLQLLYDDFRNDKPVQLRVKEYVTSDLQPVKFAQRPLFSQNIDMRQMPRVKAYLKSIGADTVVVTTPPSISDYADKKSGNGATVTYYATGKSKKGMEYKNEKLDISNILDSQIGKLKDTVLFDNGEGRIVVDLRKSVNVEKINMYFDQFRNRGSQIFTIWVSSKESGLSGDPKVNGWQYVGPYGLSGRGVSSSGTSLVFDNGLQCRYIMFISDGNWHGTEYLKQLDIIEKK
ncbi:MAG: glycosyl hydrolase-related protein [Bacteroidia bacterium]|nr:glycosyl hydrolase-related protein [Bacteroidia bacterium]